MDYCLGDPDGSATMWTAQPDVDVNGDGVFDAVGLDFDGDGALDDALGVDRPATERLRSIAHIGVRTRDFAFSVNGLAPTPDPFLVELSAPDGSTWSWGPQDAAQRVTGSARDFCMLVTQRRPRAELDVTAHGDDAERWLSIAQAFAGPPGPGRG